jgi:hypothetical protein
MLRLISRLFVLFLFPALPVSASVSIIGGPTRWYLTPLDAAASPQTVAPGSQTPLFPPAASLYWAAATAVTSASLTVAEGCLTSDKLEVASAAPLADPCSWVFVPGGPLTALAAALRAVNFTVARAVPGPPSLLRVLSLTLVGSGATKATLFTALRVAADSNRAPVFFAPTAVVALSEGGAPDFAAVVAQNCTLAAPGRVALGLPVLCWEDDDPPVTRDTRGLDAFSGGAPHDAAATVLASAYSVAFSSFTWSGSSSAGCTLNARVATVGAPLYDCSAAPLANATSATSPVPCFWQRLRLTVGAAPSGAGVPNASTCANCALDYEAAYCSNATAAATVAASFSASLRFSANATLTDNAMNRSLALNPIPAAPQRVSLTLINAPEAAVLAWPTAADAPLLSALNAGNAAQWISAPAGAGPPLSVDDRTGLPPNATPPTVFFVCCQDADNGCPAVRVVGPVEGGGGSGANGLLAPMFISAAQRRPLRDASACAAAFAAASAAARARGEATGGVAPPQLGAAWTWVRAAALRSAAAGLLAALPERVLHFAAWAPAPGAALGALAAGDAAAAASGNASGVLQLVVHLVRGNAPVAWAPLPPALQLGTGAAAAGVSSTAALNVTDADSEQDVAFAFEGAPVATACTAASGAVITLPPSGVPLPGGALALRPVVGAPYLAVDAARPGAPPARVPATRAVRLSLSDAFDVRSIAPALGAGGASCVVSFALRATDSGDFSGTHSLLPPVARSTAVVVGTLTLRDDLGAAGVDAVEGPPEGLRGEGGDVVVLRGWNLSLPGLTALLAAPGATAPAAFFNLTNCTVKEPAAALSCVSTPGWGAGLELRVSAFAARGGGGAFSSAPRVSYAPALVLGVAGALPVAGGAAPLNATWLAAANTSAAQQWDAGAGGAGAGSNVTAYAVRAGAPLAPSGSASFALLLSGLPPAAFLRGRRMCASAWVALLEGPPGADGGAVVPAGQCTADGGGAPLPQGAPPTAVWFTCPLPPLVGGGGRRVAAALSVNTSCPPAPVPASFADRALTLNVSAAPGRTLAYLSRLTPVALQPPPATTLVSVADLYSGCQESAPAPGAPRCCDRLLRTRYTDNAACGSNATGGWVALDVSPWGELRAVAVRNGTGATLRLLRTLPNGVVVLVWAALVPPPPVGAGPEVTVNVTSALGAGAVAGSFSRATVPQPYSDAVELLLRSTTLPLGGAAGGGGGGGGAPVVRGVTQDARGGSFTVTGDFFGSAGTTADGDAVEYAFSQGGGCRESGLRASCAVLRGVGCQFVGAAAGTLSCALDPLGWGAGYRYVRVVVAGAASEWFYSTQGLAYSAPRLVSVGPFFPTGVSPELAVGALTGVLPPGGGGLLVVNGTGLWPPHAVVVTVGGVRVFPVDARRLGADTLAPPACAAGAGCFGDSGGAWGSASAVPPSMAGSATLLFAAPPGFGSVQVGVCVGDVCVSANAAYAQPQLLTPIVEARNVDPPSVTLRFAAAGLPLCLLCPGASLACVFRRESGEGLSTVAAAARLPPAAGTGEGALPAPHPAKFSLDACALPSALWVWSNGTDGPGNRVREVTRAPSLVVKLSSSTGEETPIVTKHIFGALWGADQLSLMVSGKDGNLSLSNRGDSAPLARFVVKFPYDSNQEPRIVGMSEPVWRPGGDGPLVALTVENTLDSGDVLVEWAPRDAGLRDREQRKQPWRGFPTAFTCPITLFSMLFITDDSNSETVRPAYAYWQAGSELQTLPNAKNYYLAAGNWTLAPQGLPCSVIKWSGCTSLPCTVKEEGVVFAPPGWAGTVYARISSSAPFPVAYTPPEVASVTPAVLSSAGGEVVIRGYNFGRSSSVGGLWNNSGAAGMAGAQPLPPDAGASRVVFTYQAIFPALEPAPRTCRVLSWNDTVIRCVAPEGVGGTLNMVTVEVAAPASVLPSGNGAGLEYIRSSSAFPFTYSPPRLNDAREGSSMECAVTLVPLANLSRGGAFCTALANASGGGVSCEPVDSRGDPSPYRGGAVVTLRGSSLSRLLTPSSSPLCAAWLETLRNGGGGGGALSAACNATDASANNFYVPRGVVTGYNGSATTGLAGGRVEPLIDPLLVSLNHNSATLVVPLLEGRVSFNFVFTARDGTVISTADGLPSGACAFDAPTPTVTSMSVMSATPAQEGDPCASLGKAEDQRPNATAACISDAVALRVAAKHAIVRAPPPCLLAQQGAGSFVTLELRGRNFGSGSAASPQRVFVAPTLGLTTSIESFIVATVVEGGAPLTVLRQVGLPATHLVPCIPLQGGSLLVTQGNETLLRCAVTAGTDQNLPEGGLTVFVAVAFRTLVLPGVLRAACPCGWYAPADCSGWRNCTCAPCPAGASCPGAFNPPVPAAGVWWGRTDKKITASGDVAGWAGRGIDVDGIGYPPWKAPPAWCKPDPWYQCGVRPGRWDWKQSPPGPFVQCPVPALCRGGGLANESICVDGAEGWMCTRCKEGWSRGYDGVCSRCPTDSLTVVIIVAVVVFALIVGGAAAAWLALRLALHTCKPGGTAARYCVPHWMRTRFRNFLLRVHARWKSSIAAEGNGAEVPAAVESAEDEGEPLRRAMARYLKQKLQLCCGNRGAAAGCVPATLRKAMYKALKGQLALLAPELGLAAFKGAAGGWAEEEEEEEEEKEGGAGARGGGPLSSAPLQHHHGGADGSAPPAPQMTANPLLQRGSTAAAAAAAAAAPGALPPEPAAAAEASAVVGDVTKLPTTPALLKSMLTFGQTLAALSSFTRSSRLPRAIRGDVQLLPNFLSTFDVVGDLGFSSLNFKCAFPVAVDGRSKLVLFAALPLIIIFFGGTLLLMLKWAAAKWASGGQQRRRTCATYCAKLNVSACVAYAELLVLPMCIGAIARSRNCQEPHFGGYQLDDPTLSCFDFSAVGASGVPFEIIKGVAWHIGVFYLAFTAFLSLFVLGPCGGAFNKVQLIESVFSVFLREYRKTYLAHAWEGLALLRKSLLLGLSTSFVYFSDLRAQMLGAAMLLSLFLVLHIYAWPYECHALNWLEMCSLLACITTSFALAPRVLASLSTGFMPNKNEQFLFDLLSLCLCALYFAMWVDAALTWSVVPALKWALVSLARGSGLLLKWLVYGCCSRAKWLVCECCKKAAKRPLAALAGVAAARERRVEEARAAQLARAEEAAAKQAAQLAEQQRLAREAAEQAAAERQRMEERKAFQSKGPRKPCGPRPKEAFGWPR